jgi:hypothetical protein
MNALMSKVPRDRPAADQPDRYRCIVFTAERLWQALLLAQAVDARTVAIDVPVIGASNTKAGEHIRRLAAALVIATGMFVRPSGAQSISVHIGQRADVLANAAQLLKDGLARARTAGLSVLPLSEMAAVLAIWADDIPIAAPGA